MKIKCHKCGYEWDTSSSMGMVTCPSCGYKTPKGEGGKMDSPDIGNVNDEDLGEVKFLKTKYLGVIVLVVALVAGVLFVGINEQNTENPADSDEPATMEWAKAAGEPTESGIENIVFLRNGSGYTLSSNLSDNSGGNVLAVLNSDGDSVNIDYDETFDIVVQAKGHNNQMAYVQVENLKVQVEATGDLSIPVENTADSDETVFDSTTGDYIRVNAQTANMIGLSVAPGASWSINVDLYTWS